MTASLMREPGARLARARPAASPAPVGGPTARLAVRPGVRPGPSPRRVDRRRKFIAAAERLFLEHGYAGASVNEVVRLAGGSLATLYAEFGTKEKLFEAVLSSRAAAIFEDGAGRSDHVADVQAELLALATKMQARILSADGLAIYRLAVWEAPRFAGLRKAVLKTGLKSFLKHLADYFAELAATGRIRIDNPHLAAERFLSLVQGQQLFVACCGDAARLDAATRRRHVAEAVQAFLHIYPAREPLARAPGRRAVGRRN